MSDTYTPMETLDDETFDDTQVKINKIISVTRSCQTVSQVAYTYDWHVRVLRNLEFINRYHREYQLMRLSTAFARAYRKVGAIK